MSNLVPLSELPSADSIDAAQPVPALTWDIELPAHVDTERLLVDSGHLSRIQKLGYFSSNHFSSYQGEVTQYEPTITGMNPDGTAIAGRKAATTKQADEFKAAQFSYAPFGVDPSNYASSLTLNTINRNELSRMVSEKLDTKPRDNQIQQAVWAETLDDVVQKSLRRSAAEKLLWRRKGYQRNFEYSYIGLMGGLMTIEMISDRHADAAALIGWIAARKAVTVAFSSVSNKELTGDSQIKELRLSLFDGMQPERYIALNGLTRVNSLIKYRK